MNLSGETPFKRKLIIAQYWIGLFEDSVLRQIKRGQPSLACIVETAVKFNVPKV